MRIPKEWNDTYTPYSTEGTSISYTYLSSQALFQTTWKGRSSHINVQFLHKILWWYLAFITLAPWHWASSWYLPPNAASPGRSLPEIPLQHPPWVPVVSSCAFPSAILTVAPGLPPCKTPTVYMWFVQNGRRVQDPVPNPLPLLDSMAALQQYESPLGSCHVMVYHKLLLTAISGCGKIQGKHIIPQVYIVQ